MVKIDLITGFLGSGKTTFLKLYAKYLMSAGNSIGILENDYGAVNVDMMLLSDLEGDNCELEMVAGGCHQDCHRRRFKTKLIALAMSGYDRVIVEPSGIFDVDEFFDVLREDPLSRMYEIGNVIAIVDSRLSDDMSKESDFYLASQIANAGMILLSRTQLSDRTSIDEVKNHLKKASIAAKLNKDIDSIIREYVWSELSQDEFAEIAQCGYELSGYVKSEAVSNNNYSSVYFLEIPLTTESIKRKIDYLMNNQDVGYVFRIKGFYIEAGKWYQVNATKREVNIEEIALGQEVVIVIGENLNKDKIEAVMKS